jgi:very-short-patch-repair endonuclease
VGDFREVLRRQGGAIHRRQLRDAGLDHRRVATLVRRGELIAVTDHVFVAASSPVTWARRAWVELLQAAAGSPLSHRTAAGLHRVGRFSTSTIEISELEDAWHRRRAPSIHRTTWLPAHHVTAIDGLPVTTLPRTIFDLAGLVSEARRERGLPSLAERQVERALDDALVGGLSLAAMHRVLAELGGRGRPGTSLVRQLLSVRGTGYVATESELEDLLVAVVVASGLEAPERQRDLGGMTPVGRVDFVFRAARVVIEADGRAHHTALLDADADRWRDLELSAAGFVVIRVTWRQLTMEPERFLVALRQLLARRGPEAIAG